MRKRWKPKASMLWCRPMTSAMPCGPSVVEQTVLAEESDANANTAGNTRIRRLRPRRDRHAQSARPDEQLQPADGHRTRLGLDAGPGGGRHPGGGAACQR